jgi:glutamate/tyrosine decarboxylase-like PLP-dependent enzyme
MRRLLIDAATRAANYIERLTLREVHAHRGAVQHLREALDVPLPAQPSLAAEVVAFLDEFGSPATVASAGGRYFGFVTGGALPVTVAAQLLAVAWDQNCFSFVSSPAVAMLESAALRWLKEALGLPATAEGALVTGATMANFTCLAAARNWTLQRRGWDVDRDGLFGAPPLSIILGEEAHATIYKVLSMLGLGRERLLRVPADAQGRMRPECLPAISGPAILCIQAGNVNSGAFDPAQELIAWARERNAWVHVDGAFGLWALACPDRASQAHAFLGADSWAVDAHKWLNVPYDSGVEIWAALKALGRSGVAELVDRHCHQAQQMAAGLKSAGVEVLNEVVLNQLVVAFGDDERTRRVIALIQDGGICWCGGTHWRGRAAMRISISSWATTEQDLERSLAAILAAHRSV